MSFTSVKRLSGGYQAHIVAFTGMFGRSAEAYPAAWNGRQADGLHSTYMDLDAQARVAHVRSAPEAFHILKQLREVSSY